MISYNIIKKVTFGSFNFYKRNICPSSKNLSILSSILSKNFDDSCFLECTLTFTERRNYETC